MRRFLPCVLAWTLATTVAACSATWQRTDAVPEIASVPHVRVEDEGPWQQGPGDDEIREGVWRVAARPFDARGDAPAGAVRAAEPVVAVAVRPPQVQPKPARPRLAIPRRKSGAPPRAKGTPPGKPPEVLAREHHLDHPTAIDAERVTLYCPPHYAQAVRLTGRDVREGRGGRRIATGAARLELRELTLEADRITLRVRDDDPDIQITARGHVAFVSRVGKQVVREEGLRSLMITNDRMVPIR